MNFISPNLARFKRPRFWYSVSELPMTGSGILRKLMLRDNTMKGKMKF